MKKIAFVIMAVSSLSFIAHAQDAKPIKNTGKVVAEADRATIEQEAIKETEQLGKLIDLTPNQKGAILNVNRNLAERKDYLNRTGNTNERTLRELDNAKLNMYGNILNGEQMTKLKELMRKR
ncbi:MAG: hypothetical protein JST52_04735 [Bacteroidetes bacterium]|nr:hypothetical protein [Bacteroidota bacterium]MBS1739843.1 hypothetical protein [Bacteroidota bacterium]MBS1776930.1 hypothetical protein [Bacteroidota bacterium]